MKKDMKFSKNEEAVSPVIGVILMVAITVILAAVIAAFVFGMGTPVATPQASLKISEAKVQGARILIDHRGGDALKLSDVKLVVYSTTSFKSTFDPLIAATNATAFSAGSTLNLTLPNGTIPNLRLDSLDLTSALSAPSTTASYYNLTQANQIVTIELWYRPNGQQLAKLEAATVS